MSFPGFQPEHLGRGRAEVAAVVLAELLRDDRRAHLGRRLGRPPQARRLQGGAPPAAAGGGWCSRVKLYIVTLLCSNFFDFCESAVKQS